MIYLRDNPLLREPLKAEHVKKRLLGHWGASPGLSFAYVHLNRLIKKYDLDAIFLAGPGHGAPGVLAPVYLEGAYSEVYPNKSEDVDGMRLFFKDFSLPRRHRQPLHAGDARLDPRGRRAGLQRVARVRRGVRQPGPARHRRRRRRRIGDRAAGDVVALEQVPQPDPRRRGPADPAPQRLQDQQPDAARRISREELENLFKGYGWTPHFVEGDDPLTMHQKMAATMEKCVLEIRRVQQEARASGKPTRPRWPMIILRTPKGWTGPKTVDGHKVEGFWRSHQVPLAGMHENPAHLKQLEDWLRSYKPEELFDDSGRLIPELKELAPKGTRRMGANPHANGGLLRKPLRMPDFRDYAVKVDKPATASAENTKPLGAFLRDIVRLNPNNFRVLCPDEMASNRLTAVYEASKKTLAGRLPPRGRRRRRALPRRPRHGDALRAHARGLARRLPAHRPARLLLHLRSLRPRDRLDVQHAREVARHLPRAAVACAGAVAQPADHLDRLAAGPQRLHPPGPRLPRRRLQQEPGRLPHLPPARRQHACSASPTTACAARTTSTSSSATSRSTSST